ncbi:MAG: hypothetical protein WKG52_00680 [Variovorax sp.]
MDRPINYPGQVPLETDLLLTNQSVMVGLAKLCQSIFGTNGIAAGFGTTQTVVPSLNVLIAPGEIYSQQNLEATAVSSLPQDLAHSIVKQGIMLDAVTLPLTPPGTAGFSVNYLVQVAYQDSDSGSTVLPYYNASNPSVAYSGPANSGAAQPTIRKGVAVVSLKAGTAATTGTQTTPAPDAGKLGMYVITVANGASTVVNANISVYPAAPLLGDAPVTKGRLLAVRTYSATATHVPTAGMTFSIVQVQAGGGAAAGATNPGAGNVSLGAPGKSGAGAMSLFTAAQIGASQVVTVGPGGAAVSAGAGGNGGSSSFGSLLSAQGGTGGGMLNNQTPPTTNGNGGTVFATGANLWQAPGNGGLPSTAISSALGAMWGGAGGGTVFGPMGQQNVANSNGIDAVTIGGGGSGVALINGGGSAIGGSGAAGRVIVWEYA